MEDLTAQAEAIVETAPPAVEIAFDGEQHAKDRAATVFTLQDHLLTAKDALRTTFHAIEVTNHTVTSEVKSAVGACLDILERTAREIARNG